MNYVIDGIRYNVKKSGSGFPLFLLHGFTGDQSTWDSFTDKWGSHSTLFQLDIIGHGQTDSPLEEKRYEMMSAVEDLCQLLDKLKIDKIDLLGYSMGGRLALSFALMYPYRVRNLILESASPGLLTEDERLSRRKQDKKLADMIIEKGISSFVDYWENIPLFESQTRLPKLKQQLIKEQRLKNSIIGLSNSLLGMGTGSQPSWWSELDELEVRTLLVTGELDIKFCLIAEKMTNKLKNSQWITVAKCGHAIHVEDAEKFGTIVSEFLSQSVD